MKKRFLSSNKWFWFIHLGCWAVVYALLVSLSLITGKGVPGQIVGGLVYVGLGILGGLLFRYLFYRRGWYSKPILRIAGISFSFIVLGSLIAGLLITFCVYLFSVFVPEWLAPLPPEMSFTHALALVFIFNSINIAIFQALWSSIYIAVVIYRKSIKREVQALRLENSLKEAQLNTLSGQLNPHFLFNALNNIRFMMRKDAAIAEEMLTHLSDLLRYALESTKLEKVTLKKELDIVGHYISLAQVQFNERLNFVEDIDLESEKFLMPPMVLQILVENAIKHGMEQLKEGGELKLVIFIDNDSIIIKVSNSFSQEKNSNGQAGFGIGLSNIQKRLDLLYSDGGKLKTEYCDSCFIATVILPVEVL